MPKPSGGLINGVGRSSPVSASALVRIFDKQRLWWTLPQFQLAEASERWSVLVSLAMWMLYLARPIVQDQPLPWQRPQLDLTPGRVKRGIGTIFRARRYQSDLVAQTARNSSRMAQRQAKETAGALSGSPKAPETANSRCLSGLKLDC